MTLTSSAILWRNEKQFAPVANRGEAKARPVRPVYQNRSTPQHFTEGRTPKNGKQGKRRKKISRDMTAALLLAMGSFGFCLSAQTEYSRLFALLVSWVCVMYTLFRYVSRVRRAKGRKS